MTTKPTRTSPTEAAAVPPAKAPSKSALVLKLLTRSRGATAAEIGEPISWQPHSVRAYLSGLRRQGRTVIREKRKTGEMAYRLVESASPVAGAPEETAVVNGEAAANAKVDATTITTPAVA